MSLYILFESPIGYALFKLKGFDEANATLSKVQKQVQNFGTFSKTISLAAFYPFESSTVALEIINKSLEGLASEQLINFLSQNFPLKKIKSCKLGLSENKLAGAINQSLSIQTTTSPIVLQLLRGIRQHFLKFLDNEQFQNMDLFQSRLGLSHTFSRNKIALDVNRADKPIIQSINLLQLLDKDINTFSMRVREWYSWHYPELVRIVSDNSLYVQLVNLVGNRATANFTLEDVQEIVGDQEIAQRVFDSCRNSMGQQISDFDMECLLQLCKKTIGLYTYRKEMQQYLKDRMNVVSPNLTTLIGEGVAAKLIAHSGSLSTLAKYPASTIQILGAQKALFRALKQRTKTPKYGLLYNTTFIGRAIGKNKGKISRYLANKCAMAARLDHFLIKPTAKFGEKLKQQVQRRLARVDDDEEYERNEELMDQIVDELKQDKLYFDSQKAFKKHAKKSKKKKQVVEQEEEAPTPKPKKKKIAKA